MKSIELSAANALLNRLEVVGFIPTPLSFKILGVFRIKLLKHHLTLAELYEITSIIKQIKLPGDDLRKINLIDAVDILNGSAELVCEALVVALRLKHKYVSRKRFARHLFNTINAHDFETLWAHILENNNIMGFSNTIRSIDRVAIYLSPQTRGSQHTKP